MKANIMRCTCTALAACTLCVSLGHAWHSVERCDMGEICAPVTPMQPEPGHQHHETARLKSPITAGASTDRSVPLTGSSIAATTGNVAAMLSIMAWGAAEQMPLTLRGSS